MNLDFEKIENAFISRLKSTDINLLSDEYFLKSLSLLKKLYYSSKSFPIPHNYNNKNHDIFLKELNLSPTIKLNIIFNITLLNKNLNKYPSKIVAGNAKTLIKKFNIDYTSTSFNNDHLISNIPLLSTPFFKDIDESLLIIDGNHRLSAKIQKNKYTIIKIIPTEVITNFILNDFQKAIFLLFYDIAYNNISNYKNNSLLYFKFKSLFDII